MFERTRAKILFNYFLKERLKLKLPYKNILKPYGADFILSISGKCSIDDLKTHTAYLRALFNSDIEIVDKKSKAVISVIYPLQEQPIIIHKPNSIPFGYSNKGNIIEADIFKYAHCLITGASGQGKSKGLEASLRAVDKLYDIFILNAYKSDYKAVKATRIDDIKGFLARQTLVYPKKRIIVIDELGSLLLDKEVGKIISRLLMNARHQNISLICLNQSALKTDIPFRSLFNCRICYSQEPTTISSFLGCSLDQVSSRLNIQEFYTNMSENGSVIKGRSFKC